MIKLVSVRIDTKNYKKPIHSLYCFDKLLTGNDVERTDAKACDVAIITDLMNREQNKQMSKEYDPYICQTFSCLVKNKRQIVLHLQYLDDTLMHDLIMNHIQRRITADYFYKDFDSEHRDYTNLFQPVIFDIFKHLNKIVIIAECYAICLSTLLSLVPFHSLPSKFTIEIKAHKNHKLSSENTEINSWIGRIWFLWSDDIKQLYNKNDLSVSFESYSPVKEEVTDILTIQKQS